MNNKNIQIDIRLVWLIALIDLANTLYILITGALNMVTLSIFLLICLSLLLQVILISDMVKNKVFNKPFWILSMLFIPKVAQFFYLIQRSKLIRHGEKLAQEKEAKE